MPRIRVPLQRKLEGQQWVTRVNHPLRGKTLRLVLAPEGEVKTAEHRLTKLNDIFLNPDHWRRPPDTCPKDIWGFWTGDATLHLPDGSSVRTAELPTSVEELAEERLGSEVYHELRDVIREPLRAEISSLNDLLERARSELKQLRDKHYRPGPVPTLQKVFDEWTTRFKARSKDAGYTKTVLSWLKRFLTDFKPETKADKIKTADVEAWISGLKNIKANSPDFGKPLGPSAKRNMRLFVLKMMRENGGVTLDETAIKPADLPVSHSIHWLTKAEALQIVAKLPAYWADLFRFQVATGLRADELVTLQRSNFRDNFSIVELRPRGQFTIKNKKSERTIQVPVEVRGIVETRLKRSDVVFPRPDGKDWETIEWYNRCFNDELRTAATAAGFTRFVPDCRTGRRTCGSLLLRGGLNLIEVAAVLGDRPETVKKHYADVKSGEVDPSAAALPMAKTRKPKSTTAEKVKAMVAKGTLKLPKARR